MKEKKSERLQLRLTQETLRRLHCVCSFYGCRMSEWFQKQVDDEYCRQVNLFDEIYKGAFDDETA